MPSVTRILALLFIPKFDAAMTVIAMAAIHNPMPCRGTSTFISSCLAWIIPIISRPSGCYGSYYVATAQLLRTTSVVRGLPPPTRPYHSDFYKP